MAKRGAKPIQTKFLAERWTPRQNLEWAAQNLHNDDAKPENATAEAWGLLQHGRDDAKSFWSMWWKDQRPESEDDAVERDDALVKMIDEVIAAARGAIVEAADAAEEEVLKGEP